MRILPYGERALLIELDTLSATMDLYPVLDARRIPGIHELVPAARTILVTLDPTALSLSAAERWINSLPASLASPTTVTTTSTSTADATVPGLLTIPAYYDGDDLPEVARLMGITEDEVIARHTGTDWHVAFIGFAPGFAYLASPDTGFDVPRRETSRPSVPAGAIGLAGEFTGIYPRSSPGGWQLIGRTTLTLWDATRQQPALLVPGMRVRFTQAESSHAELAT
ncbi:MAG TPA: allophanate hydrolase subunit 1 [Glaciihabitans sp.]|jgi:KipI family sensor histidine kinase inhibitor|nr:allophanate hydrolase subunit 1 [Glaciihabitans sp.]